MSEGKNFDQPFNLGPTWNVYGAFCAMAALPAISSFIESWEKKTPFVTAYEWLFLPLLAVIYLRNTIVRLEERRIVQGFLGASIQYEDIEGVHREVRRGKGSRRFPILAITKQDSSRRILVHISFVDDAKLRQFVRLLKQKAPQISVGGLILTPFTSALER